MSTRKGCLGRCDETMAAPGPRGLRSDPKSLFQWIGLVDQKRVLARDPRCAFDLGDYRRIFPDGGPSDDPAREAMPMRLS